MSSSPSPSEDNHRNTLQDSTSKALDRIMANTEQSYDDFVSSFTFLKKDEVLTMKTPQGTSLAALQKKMSPNTSTVTTSKVIQPENYKTSLQDTRTVSYEEELVTEILGEGTTSSRMSHSKMLCTGASVKVDNFVETDVDDDIQNPSTDGYCASFSADSSQQSLTRRGQTAQPRDSRPTNDMADLFNGQLSLDENSTDKLLMNFMADLQNEANEQSAAVPPAQGDSSLNIQNFLDKKHAESEEVSFSDDDSESASKLLDNSEECKIKVVVKHDELEAIQSKQKREPRSHKSDANIDSEGNKIENEHEKPMAKPNEMAENPNSIVFPGEVEDTEVIPGKKSESMLDFKAVSREPSAEPTEGTIQVECSNSVEVFQLDQDFDYDNIVLTPKFSQADINRLQATKVNM